MMSVLDVLIALAWSHVDIGLVVIVHRHFSYSIAHDDHSLTENRCYGVVFIDA